MELLRDISELWGLSDLSTEECQAYLDSPCFEDTCALTKCLDTEALVDVLRQLEKVSADELEDRSIGIHVKRIGAGAFSTLNNASDHNGENQAIHSALS